MSQHSNPETVPGSGAAPSVLHTPVRPDLIREALQQTTGVLLRGRAAIILPGQVPIMNRNDTRERIGYDGELIATITLPGGIAPDQSPKEIGIIDFGRDAEEPGGKVAFYVGEQPLPLLGRVRATADQTGSRFALAALNYVPRSHFKTRQMLGKPVTIGRNSSSASYVLGIGGSTEPGNEFISKYQTTVAVDSNGAVVVYDRSTNGTYLRTHPEAVVQLHTRDEIIEMLGGSAITGQQPE